LIGFFLCSQKIVFFSWSSTWFKKYFLAIYYFYAFITGGWVVFYLFICFSWLVGVHWSVLVSFFVLFVCSGHLYWGRVRGHIIESGVLQISTCPRWSHVVLIWGSPLSKGVPFVPPLPFPYVPLWFGIGPYYLCEISKLCLFMLSSLS
jgi:hypothetical protein